jgi:hypothetical protein
VLVFVAVPAARFVGQVSGASLPKMRVSSTELLRWAVQVVAVDMRGYSQSTIPPKESECVVGCVFSGEGEGVMLELMP